jgi:branched-chain amino acid transport system substrate-binding protein
MIKLLCIGSCFIGAIVMMSPVSAQEGKKISDDVVKIGVLTDMSSVYSESGGQGSVIAAKMAIADFGGKVLGKPIELITADHQNKADIGASKAREWIDTQQVDMITDLITSSVALAVAKVTHEKKKVNMTVGAGTTRLTNEDCSPYTVHYAYDTYALANGTAKTVTQQGGNTWYFMTADYVFGHSLEKDATEVINANGGKVIGAVRHPLNASDFSSFIVQAQASKAKIIGLANAGNDMINTLKTARDFGLNKGDQRFAGMLININDTHSMGLEVAQNMLLTEGFYWDRTDESRTFSKRYFEVAKKMPNMIHAGVYSAVTNYLKAVQAAGTDEADSVMTKLKSTKINDFYASNGVIREDGRMVHDMYLVEVKKPSESKYPWDYYRVKQTIPGAEAFQPLSKSKCQLIKVKN